MIAELALAVALFDLALIVAAFVGVAVAVRKLQPLFDGLAKLQPLFDGLAPMLAMLSPPTSSSSPAVHWTPTGEHAIPGDLLDVDGEPVE